MLQLPQPSPTKGRFSRAATAAITRGDKAKVRKSKPDPIIAMIAKADLALGWYYQALVERWRISESLPEEHRGFPSLDPPEALRREFGFSFFFTSERHVHHMFRTSAERARQRVAHYKASLKNWEKPGHEQMRRETTASLAADRQLLVLLKNLKKKCIADFRRDERRLLLIQRKAGLLDARKDLADVTKKLRRLTEVMADAHPKTIEGAMALVGYVQHRLSCDRPELFHDFNGAFPGNFCELLERAHNVLDSHFKRAADVSTPHH